MDNKTFARALHESVRPAGVLAFSLGERKWMGAYHFIRGDPWPRWDIAAISMALLCLTPGPE